MAKRASAKGPEPTAAPWWQGWLWLLPLLIAAAAYTPTLWGGALAWDDQIVIQQQLPAFKSWRDALWPPAGLEQWSHGYYRPIVVLSYMLDRALFGGGTAGPHFSNLVFHGIATLGLYALLRRLLGSGTAGLAGALAGACLFAVHPVHTESVSWISGRSDVIATMFLLPALTLALRWRDTSSWPALAGVAIALLLAMLSKEVSVAAFAIVPATLILAPRPVSGEPAPRMAVIRSWTGIAVALAAVGIIFIALRSSAGADAMGSGPLAWPQDLWSPAKSVAFVAIKAVWPWPQMHFVTDRVLPGTAVTLVVLAAVAGLLGWSIARWRRRGDGLPLLAVIWFGAATAPVVAAFVLKLAQTPVAERYLYLPTVAAALLFSLVIATLVFGGRRIAAAAAITVIVLVYSAGTFQRALVWQNDLALWSDAVAKSPGEALPLNALAAAWDANGDTDRALQLWLRARGLARDAQIAGTVDGNIGLVYLRRGDYATARTYFESALRYHELQQNAQRGLGAVLFELAAVIPLSAASVAEVRSLLEASRGHYEIALRVSPFAISPRLELALVLARLGDVANRFGGRESPAELYEAALTQLERVFSQNPAAAEVPATRALADNLRAALARRAH